MARDSIRNTSVAFIGFGEAATAILSGWGAERPARIAAYDIKTDDPAARDAMCARYRELDVRGAASPAEALASADAVFCLVTADQAENAARAAAGHLNQGTLWLDGNSCAPGTKVRAAAAIEAAGGRYVDVALMAPVHPKRHHVPLLVSGPHAAAGEALLLALDMKPKLAGDRVGQASSIKMLRSVMVKGMEALTAECFLAARRAGVEEQVIASLEASSPEIDWRGRGTYNLERMMVHGQRRAAEMREVAATVAELGLGGAMSAAAADWQDRIGALGVDAGADDLIERADRLLSRL